jgi:hypothetical protein
MFNPFMFKTIKDAEKIAYTLSTPSKMPCFSYSIPAQKCITGAKLRNVKNSVCASCYSLKGRYLFPNVKNALFRRLESLNHPQWVEAMVFMIGKREKSGFFRWSEAGDLQGVWHLEKIVEVCRRLPHITFWLPTREFSIVSEYTKSHTLPSNLTIRLSALMVEGEPPKGIAKRLGLVTSGVSKGSFNCPSSKQGGKCLDCRACWDKKVKNVNYKLH